MERFQVQKVSLDRKAWQPVFHFEKAQGSAFSIFPVLFILPVFQEEPLLEMEKPLLPAFNLLGVCMEQQESSSLTDLGSKRGVRLGRRRTDQPESSFRGSI